MEYPHSQPTDSQLPTHFRSAGNHRIVAFRLFRGSHLESVLAGHQQAYSKEINSLSESRILNTSPEDLCSYFVEKYRVEPIVLDESAIQMDYGDTQVDVSRRFEYAIIDRSGPHYVTGTKITFYVPFEGDWRLFTCRPSTSRLSSTRADIRVSELVFVYEGTMQDTRGVGKQFEQDLNSLKENLGWIASDVERFNSTIRQNVNDQIDQRRDKLLQDRKIVASLGFPLRRRSGVPSTYAVPEVKRRIVPKLPSVSSDPSEPDPTLAMNVYEHILSVIWNMVMVMERSPTAFKDMGEEHLRQHFLVQLNGQYEGQATGETFNYEGRTDILVRARGRNIFIAECKFWRGPADLKKAIDQLLGYTSWRDTKAALLIFNRDTGMSTVLKKVPEAVREHPNWKSNCDYDHETGFRYLFTHRDDPSRTITLTVLVFNVPA